MPNETNSGEWQALSIFAIKYGPAPIGAGTDTFTSREIQKIIYQHTGITIDLTELHNLLTEMKYQYDLLEDSFQWFVEKV